MFRWFHFTRTFDRRDQAIVCGSAAAPRGGDHPESPSTLLGGTNSSYIDREARPRATICHEDHHESGQGKTAVHPHSSISLTTAKYIRSRTPKPREMTRTTASENLFCTHRCFLSLPSFVCFGFCSSDAGEALELQGRFVLLLLLFLESRFLAPPSSCYFLLCASLPSEGLDPVSLRNARVDLGGRIRVRGIGSVSSDTSCTHKVNNGKVCDS